MNLLIAYRRMIKWRTKLTTATGLLPYNAQLRYENRPQHRCGVGEAILHYQVLHDVKKR